MRVGGKPFLRAPGPSAGGRLSGGSRGSWLPGARVAAVECPLHTRRVFGVFRFCAVPAHEVLLFFLVCRQGSGDPQGSSGTSRADLSSLFAAMPRCPPTRVGPSLPQGADDPLPDWGLAGRGALPGSQRAPGRRCASLTRRTRLGFNDLIWEEDVLPWAWVP